MTNIDDVAQTLAEYERLAITSGAKVQIDPPEFSDGGPAWAPFWLSTDHPQVARATVHRDGIPTTVYVVWDESLPIESAQTDDGRLWRDLWLAQPTKRFGSFALRTALRRAFREVVGDRVEPDEDAPRIASTEPKGHRNWAAEYRAATEVDQLDGIRRDCRAARENTLELQELWRARRAEIVAAEWTPPAPDLSDEEAIRHRAFFEQPEEIRPDKPPIGITGPVVGPRRSGKAAPQDHLPPTNRAARRASKRKGRR